MKRLFLIFLTSPLMAQGRLPPRAESDPATWEDVQNVQSQVTTNAQQEQAAATSINNKLDDMNKLKYQIGTTVRLYDAKYGSINFFSFTDIQGSGSNAVGLNFGFKLGKSYEERLLEKQQKEIDYLVSKLNSH